MVHSNVRAQGHEHVPLLPKGFIAIRYVQLVIAVVVLGLDAYGLSLLIFAGDCLNIFMAIATIIICIYNIVAHYKPTLYNYWAVLSLDIFAVVFWLISFALMAADVVVFIALYSSYYGYYDDGSYSTYSLSGIRLVFAACMSAVAGLGGLEFLLFIISMIMMSVYIHRHRRAGLHCRPGFHGGEKPAAGPPGAPGSTMPVYQGAAVQHPTQAYNQPPVYHQGQTMTPPPQQMYTPPSSQNVSPGPHGVAAHGQPIAAPAPYYPQQTPSPLHAQHTGQSYGSPVQHQQHPQPPVAGGAYHETQGSQVPYGSPVHQQPPPQ